jgi:hypothetical protein
MLDLKNRDTIGVLIGLVKLKGSTFYCMAPVENWIVEYWNGYVDLSKGSLELQYFEYLKKFKLDYAELVQSYKSLIPNGDVFDIEGNKPKIYADFDLKIFKSNFFEQSLESRMSNGWIGEYGNFEEMIPDHLNYWIN